MTSLPVRESWILVKDEACCVVRLELSELLESSLVEEDLLRTKENDQRVRPPLNLLFYPYSYRWW